jgi:hypothetical protein
MYLIAKCTGKGFIEQSRKFNISGYVGDVWKLDDSTYAKAWEEEQERFNEGKIVDKETAQTAINKASNDFDINGNPQTPYQL